MGRGVHGWERMSPVGEGESGTPGPLFPRLFPLGHLARAGPGSPALAVFETIIPLETGRKVDLWLIYSSQVWAT